LRECRRVFEADVRVGLFDFEGLRGVVFFELNENVFVFIVINFTSFLTLNIKTVLNILGANLSQ